MKDEILSILTAIANEIDYTGQGYSEQKKLINDVFAGTASHYDELAIQRRLVVIDSLYSTNASYSYFSFEEMAEKIKLLGEAEEANAYFYEIAQGGQDTKGIFSEAYGVQKNLKEGSKQMSLISKYAYYCLLQNQKEYPLGFPIYDKLAKEMCPKVLHLLAPKNKKLTLGQDPTITDYVRVLTTLREQLFDGTDLFHGFQQFDILDAYLWRMGKINGGNLSLLLSRDEYADFVKSLGLQIKKNESDTDYKERVGIDSKFTFDDKVLKLLRASKKPFKGIKEPQRQEYMTTLFEHWKLLTNN